MSSCKSGPSIEVTLYSRNTSTLLADLMLILLTLDTIVYHTVTLGYLQLQITARPIDQL